MLNKDKYGGSAYICHGVQPRFPASLTVGNEDRHSAEHQDLTDNSVLGA